VDLRLAGTLPRARAACSTSNPARPASRYKPGPGRGCWR
jgi:hypothetical protein